MRPLPTPTLAPCLAAPPPLTFLPAARATCPGTPEFSLPQPGAPLHVASSMPGPLPAMLLLHQSVWQSPTHFPRQSTQLRLPSPTGSPSDLEAFIISLPQIILYHFTLCFFLASSIIGNYLAYLFIVACLFSARV